MNKYLAIVLLFAAPGIGAQPAVEYTDPPLVLDTLAVTVDNASVNDSVMYAERKFDSNFKEKYSEPEFVYERKAAERTQWDRFIEWLAGLINDIFSFGKSDKASSAIVIIIRTIAVLILLLVIYLIVKAILNKEGSWIFGRSRKKITANDVTVEDLMVMDFDKLVGETKKTGDYRLAVRYYYLWLLKKLSAREIIDWNFEKTNSDYLYEIKDERLKTDFEYLSYLYDYSWYGEFPLDEAAFNKAEKAFTKTFNTL